MVLLREIDHLVPRELAMTAMTAMTRILLRMTAVIVVTVMLLVILERLLQLNLTQPSIFPNALTSEADVYQKPTRTHWQKGFKIYSVDEDRLRKRFRVLA